MAIGEPKRKRSVFGFVLAQVGQGTRVRRVVRNRVWSDVGPFEPRISLLPLLFFFFLSCRKT